MKKIFLILATIASFLEGILIVWRFIDFIVGRSQGSFSDEGGIGLLFTIVTTMLILPEFLVSWYGVKYLRKGEYKTSDVFVISICAFAPILFLVGSLALLLILNIVSKYVGR